MELSIKLMLQYWGNSDLFNIYLWTFVTTVKYEFYIVILNVLIIWTFSVFIVINDVYYPVVVWCSRCYVKFM